MVTANDVIETHEAIIRVFGIKSIQAPLHLGPVNYKVFTETDQSEIDIDFQRRDLARDAQFSFPRLESRIKSIGSALIQKPVAVCNVRCVWSDAADRAAELVKKANRTLNALALVHYRDSSINRVYSPDEDHGYPREDTTIILRSLDSWTYQVITHGRMAGKDLNLDEDFSNALGDEEAQCLLRLQEPDSKFLRKLDQALNWFERARKAASNSEKVICYTTVLEILFGNTTDTSKTAGISEGVAITIAEEANERMQIRERIKILYRKRSALLHDGIWQFDRDEVHELLNYSFIALINITLRHSDCQDSDVFGERLMKIKLGGPPF